MLIIGNANLSHRRPASRAGPKMRRFMRFDRDSSLAAANWWYNILRYHETWWQYGDTLVWCGMYNPMDIHLLLMAKKTLCCFTCSQRMLFRCNWQELTTLRIGHTVTCFVSTGLVTLTHAPTTHEWADLYCSLGPVVFVAGLWPNLCGK